MLFQVRQNGAEINTAFGAKTVFVTPKEIKEICPDVDINGGGIWPVMGASYHEEGATARHDRVNWALAEGANMRGVHIHQRTEVTELIKEGERVIG
ncbi:MAG: FAD-dependent oxidoreductase, partial [Spirochaetota bacterium]